MLLLHLSLTPGSCQNRNSQSVNSCNKWYGNTGGCEGGWKVPLHTQPFIFFPGTCSQCCGRRDGPIHSLLHRASSVEKAWPGCSKDCRLDWFLPTTPRLPRTTCLGVLLRHRGNRLGSPVSPPRLQPEAASNLLGKSPAPAPASPPPGPWVHPHPPPASVRLVISKQERGGCSGDPRGSPTNQNTTTLG